MRTFEIFIQHLEEEAISDEVLIQEKSVDLHEINMSRLQAHTQGRELGIITANRSKPDHHPDWDRIKDMKPKQRQDEINRINTEANRRLENDIQKCGFGYTKVRGRYIEHYGDKKNETPSDEHSFLIFGRKKGDDGGAVKHFLKTHGAKYRQENVFHKAHNETDGHLIGTKEGAFPGLGRQHNTGPFHPNRVSEFHSILHGGFGKEKQSKKYIRPKGSAPMTLGHQRILPPSKKPFAFAKKAETRPAE